MSIFEEYGAFKSSAQIRLYLPGVCTVSQNKPLIQNLITYST